MASEKLTKTLLSGLEPPPPGKRTTINDTEVPKLAVRMTHAGVRTFYVVKRAGPSVAWIKLGVFPDMTVEQARKEAQKVLGEFAAGRLKQRLTARNLNEAAAVMLHLLHHRPHCPAFGGFVPRVAPQAIQVAARQPHKSAGQPRAR